MCNDHVDSRQQGVACEGGQVFLQASMTQMTANVM
jgi:hypothetical protein